MQRLNLLRRDVDEQTVVDCDQRDGVEHSYDSIASVGLNEPQSQVTSFSYADVSMLLSNAFSLWFIVRL